AERAIAVLLYLSAAGCSSTASAGRDGQAGHDHHAPAGRPPPGACCHLADNPLTIPRSPPVVAGWLARSQSGAGGSWGGAHGCRRDRHHRGRDGTLTPTPPSTAASKTPSAAWPRPDCSLTP